MAGEVDFKFGSAVTSPDNQAVLLENAEKGHYRLAPTAAPSVVTSFDLNETVTDPVKREVFRNKDFRIGLSCAMNRTEISDLVYFGVKQPARIRPDRRLADLRQGIRRAVHRVQS